MIFLQNIFWQVLTTQAALLSIAHAENHKPINS